MRFAKISLVLLILLVPTIYAQTQVAYDGFESGTFCGGSGWATSCWTISGTTAIRGWTQPYEGNRHAWMRSNTGILNRTADTSSYSQVNLSFAVRVNSFENGDQAILQVSLDGAAYQTLRTWTPLDSDNIWKIESFMIDLAGADSINVRFQAGMSDFGDELHLDNIQLTGYSAPNQEIILNMASNYPVSTSATVFFSSTEPSTLHTIELSRPAGEIFCQTNILSPVTPYTLMESSCALPETPMTDAKAMVYVTNDPSINATTYFNTLELQENKDQLKIKHVYFSPQVLQGGYSEIFVLIEKSSLINITQATLQITYPDLSTRRIPFLPTTNPDEYRAFITDTYQSGNTSFDIQIQSSEYQDSYSSYYTVVPYTLDFVEAVNQVLRIMTQPPNIDVLGTYYEVGDTAKIIAQLSDQGRPINNATCYASAYYPDASPLTRHSMMKYIPNSDGIYHYDIIVPDVVGVYPVSVVCDYQTYDETLFVESIIIANGTLISGAINDTYYSDSNIVVIEGEVMNNKTYVELFLTHDLSNLSLQNTTEAYSYWEGTCEKPGAVGYMHWYNVNTGAWDTSDNTISHSLNSQSFDMPSGQIYDYINASGEILLKFNGSAPYIMEAKTVFYEDWEGNVSDWAFTNQASQSGIGAINGSYSLRFIGAFPGPNRYSTATNSISTINQSNISVSYYRVCSGMESSDYFEFLTSTDGATWTTHETFNGNSPLTKQTFYLDSSYDNSTIYIRFAQYANNANDICWVDDVNIYSEKLPGLGFSVDVLNLRIIDISGVVNEVRGGAEFNVKKRMQDLIDLISGISFNATSTLMSFNPPYSYLEGEPAIISHRIMYTQAGVTNLETGASCTINIFGPANASSRGPEFEANMTEVGAGTYSYVFEPAEQGTYSVESNCVKDDRNYYSLTSIRIERPIDSYNTQITPTYSTIYNMDEDAVISARLTYMDSGYQFLETGASCYLTVDGPTNSTGFGPNLVINQLMTEYGSGVYYGVIDPVFTGVYTAQISCNNSGRDYHTLITVRIERDVYAYLVSVIEAKIDNITSQLNGISTNMSSNQQELLNELASLQGNVTRNYQELLDLGDDLTAVETNLENQLLIINNSINILKAYVQQNLTSQIDQGFNDLSDFLNQLNYTVQGIDSYIKMNLTNQISDIGTDVQDVLNNQSYLASRLDEIQQNITANYLKIGIMQQLLQDVNTSLTAEINMNKQHLTLINTTVNLIYDEIINNINPSLTGIENNLSSIFIDIEEIYNNTDTLEAGQLDILQNLSSIWNQLGLLNQSELLARFDIVDSTLAGIGQEVDYIEAKLDCNHTINVICDLLNQMDGKLDAINSSVIDIDAYLQNNVSQDLSNIYSVVNSMNLTLTGLESYVMNNLTNDVSNIQSDVLAILINTSNIWDSIQDLQLNISDQGSRFDIIEAMLQSVNQTVFDAQTSLTAEINENKQHLLLLNTTVNLIYSEILNNINPSLTSIQSNLSLMQSDITTIIANTDSLEAGQQGILANLTLLQSLISSLNFTVDLSSLEGKLDNLTIEVGYIEAKLDCNHTQNIICDRLDAIQNSIYAVNSTIESINTYLVTNISSDLSYITNVMNNINLTVSSMQSYLNTTIYPAIDDIESYLLDVFSNQTLIYQEILNLKLNVTQNGAQLDLIQTMIGYLNQTVLDVQSNLSIQINQNQAKLDIITSIVNQTQYYLENNLTIKVDNIIDIVNAINLTVEGINTYLTTNITTQLDSMDIKLDQILINASNIWDLLITIQSNVTGNSLDLEMIKNMIQAVNATQNANAASIIAEINVNEAKIDAINTTVNTILTRILTIIEPQLDGIAGNITQINTNIVTINNSLTTIQANQVSMQANISILQSSINGLSGNLSILDGDLFNLTSSVLTINTTMHDRFDILEELIANISIQVNASIGSINLECNNTGYSVCEMLDMIYNNTQDIKNDTAFIKVYLVENVTNILNNINQTVTEIYEINIDMNSTLNEILLILRGANASNLYPIDVNIIDPSGLTLDRYALNFSINATLKSSSGNVINYSIVKIFNSQNQVVWSNTSNFINSTDYQLEVIGRPYNLPSGNYILSIQAFDTAGYSGVEVEPFEIGNKVPDTPLIITPNGGELYIGTVNVTWNDTLDADQDDLTLVFEYSADNGTNWNSAFQDTAPLVFTNISCNLTTLFYASGNFTSNAAVNLNWLSTILDKTGIFIMTLNDSSGLVKNSTAYCWENETCKFLFNGILIPTDTYIWQIRSDSGILADSYHCNSSGSGWVGSGNQSMLTLKATPNYNLVNWDVSALDGSTNYLIRLRTYDGIDYSTWDQSDAVWTIIQPSTGGPGGFGGSGNYQEPEDEDFEFCNVETGECFEREDIFAEEEQTTFLSLVPFGEILGNFNGSIAMQNIADTFEGAGNLITGAATYVGNLGESNFGVPGLVFIIIVIIIIATLIIFIINRRDENED